MSSQKTWLAPAQLSTYVCSFQSTVYLCHPFLAHAAQPHHGREPRFLAQPPLLLRQELQIEGSKGGYFPVEEAIRLGLNF
ncbi:hypothetical protein [Larkinella sp.]|uniref:hypothetical protein n=1 Tax=Larkinella sp. TaxID=2034517 RepID=UPI003BABA62A